MTVDLAEKRPEDARRRVESAIAAAPKSDALYIVAGRLYAHVKDMTAAERAFRQALAVNPNNFQAYALLGGVFASQNRLQEAAA